MHKQASAPANGAFGALAKLTPGEKKLGNPHIVWSQFAWGQAALVPLYNPTILFQAVPRDPVFIK